MEAVNEAWGAVDRGWSDAANHDKFVSLCSMLGELGFAARQYRASAATDPSRHEEAQKRINSITLIATQSLLAEPRTDPSVGTRWVRIAGLVVALSLVVAAVVHYLAIR